MSEHEVDATPPSSASEGERCRCGHPQHKGGRCKNTVYMHRFCGQCQTEGAIEMADAPLPGPPSSEVSGEDDAEPCSLPGPAALCRFAAWWRRHTFGWADPSKCRVPAHGAWHARDAEIARLNELLVRQHEAAMIRQEVIDGQTAEIAALRARIAELEGR